MNNLEKNTIKSIAKLSPWLAPLPSAYFVARSAIVHLALPLPVAVVVAAIIETLGLEPVMNYRKWLVFREKTCESSSKLASRAIGLSRFRLILGHFRCDSQSS